MLYVCYLCLFALPSIVVDICQIRHIKTFAKKKPIILSPSDYKSSAKYAIANLNLSIISTIIDAIIFVCWVSFGLQILQEMLNEESFMLESVAFVLGFLVISFIVSLPLKAYKQLVLDKKYGFSTMSGWLFISDCFKSLCLMMLFGAVVIWALLEVMNYEYWWLFGFGIVFVLLIALNMIYPTLLAPLFNTFTPLNDENLTSRITQLITKAGFSANGVYVMDASKRDGRLNAYFWGIGNAKRVVLFDTLLEKVSNNGLLAILGHELGHFKYKDLYYNMAMMSGVLFVLFFVAGHFPISLFASIGLERNNATVLVGLLLVSPIITFWIMPLIGYFSRRAEFRADSYGALLTSSHCLKEALIRLVNENKTFPYSHWLYVFFHYTHPPLLDRLCALSNDKNADNSSSAA